MYALRASLILCKSESMERQKKEVVQRMVRTEQEVCHNVLQGELSQKGDIELTLYPSIHIGPAPYVPLIRC